MISSTATLRRIGAHVPPEVAVGDDAFQVAVGIDDDDAA
jgi:hypothetical protein